MSEQGPHNERRRDDFSRFASVMNDRMNKQDAILELQTTQLRDINVALFAKDDKNVNEQPGLMVTARNLDNHIKVICRLGRWSWKIALAVLTLWGALKGAGILL